MIKAIDADEKNSSSTKKNIKNYCLNWVRSHCYNGKTLTSDSDLDKQIVRTKSKRFENITIKKTPPFYNAIIQCIEFVQKFLMLTITEYTYISYIYIYLSLCLSISYIIYHIYKYIYIYIYIYYIYFLYIYITSFPPNYTENVYFGVAEKSFKDSTTTPNLFRTKITQTKCNLEHRKRMSTI